MITVIFEDSPVNKRLIQAFLIVMLLIAAPWPVRGLEALTEGQMKRSVAQAGVSIIINGNTYEKFSDSLSFADPDDPSKYAGFTGIHRLTTLNNGMTDVDGDGLINPLTLDVGTYHSLAMILIDSPDLEIITNTTIDSLDFCGTSLGSLSIESMVISSLYGAFGPHDISGISFEAGFAFSLDTFRYQYNTSQALTLSGLSLAASFGGTLEDPSTWTSTGRFQLGDVAGGRSATLDIVSDSVQEWNFTDTNNVTHTFTNPRYNTGYIALNLPMTGSVRLENISFGGTDSGDLGVVAIDNINVEKLYIEIPGRGLGKP